jgi:O-antigen/teichoic acid export membrane protein
MEPVKQRNKPNLPDSFSEKVAKGGMWVFGLRIMNRSLAFIRTIILARLLAPEDFGLLGIAMLSISTLETFSQTGFETVLVQKQNVESYLDTAWTVSAIRGILLLAILLGAAPMIAKFFNSPDAILVIRVLAISTILSGFTNIGIIFFIKEMEFNKQFLYEFSAILVDLTISITLAFLLRNVWALVWGGLAAKIIRLFLSYILHDYRPRIRLQKEKFKELYRFGKWIVGSTILVFLITQGDDIFVGKILGVTALGLYQMAFLIANLPTTEITRVITHITFPAYSKLQDDMPRLREGYLKVLQLTAFLAIPAAGGIFVLAPDFTRLFLTQKWLPMVPAMQVLTLAGLLRSIASTMSPVFFAVNRPDIDTKLQTIRLLCLAVFIYPLTVHWGLYGASCAVLLGISISSALFSFMIIKITKCNVSHFIKIIICPFINTSIIVLIIYFIKTFFKSYNIWHLSLIAIIFCLNYLLITYLFDKLLNYGIYKIIKENIVPVR